MRLSRRAALMLPMAAGLAGGWVSPAPDVVLYTLPELRAVGAALGRRFAARRGIAVHGFAAPPLGLMGLIRHRARDDVVMADEATLQALVTSELVLADSVTTLGRDPYVLIGPTGMASLTVAEALAKYQVVVTDPTSAASFDGRGLLAVVAGRAPVAAPVGVATLPELRAAVAKGGERVGLTRASAAFGARGVRVVAEIPADLVPPVAISGGLTRNGQSDEAKAFLRFAGGEARGVWRAAGMEAAA